MSTCPRCPVPRSLGETIRTAREAKDVSLRELARRLDLSPSYLSDIENDRRVPAEDVLRRLAGHLLLESNDLLSRAGRLGDFTERYLREHPAAIRFARRLASTHLTEVQLQELADVVEGMVRRD